MDGLGIGAARMPVRSVDTIVKGLDGFDSERYDVVYLTLCRGNELFSIYIAV